MIKIAERNELQALTQWLRIQLQSQPAAECEAQIAAAMRSYPHSPVPHNLMGILYSCLHQNLLALKHFRAAAALDPTYAPARCNLERCTSMRRQGGFVYEESECSLDTAANRWKIVLDEKGIRHVVRRER